jgi:N-acetyl-gamma-glutamyl-phosphate reductase common form
LKPITVCVVGAKGLLAAETLRLAADHPHIANCIAFSRTPMSDLRVVHPHLPNAQPVRALTDLSDVLADALKVGTTALIFATPHGVSGELWTKVEQELNTRDVETTQLRVVDLSEDHRLGSAGSVDDGSGGWSYGLPELHPINTDVRRVAAAGCFATAMQLAVMPLVRASLVDVGLPFILQGVTASSGSGATATVGTHHPYRRNDFHPYALAGHRHEKELCHKRNFELAPQLVFLPYSAPLGRGIYLTAHLPLLPNIGAEQLQECFVNAYANAPFIQLLENEAPHLRAVAGSNRVAIGWNHHPRMAQVFVALDNTIKGGAGQGLQCLNLMCGLAETTGLPMAGHGY